MKRVTGIGGVFFKCRDADAQREWYRKHLGIESESWGGFAFEWREKDDPDRVGMTVWSPMPETTDYLDPSTARFMINYRVDDLESVLARLQEEGVDVDDRRDDSEFGRFGWVTDLEGNRVELWQPPDA